jgi:small subunit ribosomal protein S18
MTKDLRGERSRKNEIISDFSLAKLLVRHCFRAMEENTDANAQPMSSVSPAALKYVDVEKLSAFVTGTGKILARKFTGLTSQQQRHVTKMIKRARNMLLMK